MDDQPELPGLVTTVDSPSPDMTRNVASLENVGSRGAISSNEKRNVADSLAADDNEEYTSDGSCTITGDMSGAKERQSESDESIEEQLEGGVAGDEDVIYYDTKEKNQAHDESETVGDAVTAVVQRHSPTETGRNSATKFERHSPENMETRSGLQLDDVQMFEEDDAEKEIAERRSGRKSDSRDEWLLNERERQQATTIAAHDFRTEDRGNALQDCTDFNSMSMHCNNLYARQSPEDNENDHLRERNTKEKEYYVAADVRQREDDDCQRYSTFTNQKDSEREKVAISSAISGGNKNVIKCKITRGASAETNGARGAGIEENGIGLHRIAPAVTVSTLESDEWSRGMVAEDHFTPAKESYDENNHWSLSSPVDDSDRRPSLKHSGGDIFENDGGYEVDAVVDPIQLSEKKRQTLGLFSDVDQSGEDEDFIGDFDQGLEKRGDVNGRSPIPSQRSSAHNRDSVERLLIPSQQTYTYAVTSQQYGTQELRNNDMRDQDGTHRHYDNRENYERFADNNSDIDKYHDDRSFPVRHRDEYLSLRDDNVDGRDVTIGEGWGWTSSSTTIRWAMKDLMDKLKLLRDKREEVVRRLAAIKSRGTKRLPTSPMYGFHGQPLQYSNRIIDSSLITPPSSTVIRSNSVPRDYLDGDNLWRDENDEIMRAVNLLQTTPTEDGTPRYFGRSRLFDEGDELDGGEEDDEEEEEEEDRNNGYQKSLQQPDMFYRVTSNGSDCTPAVLGVNGNVTETRRSADLHNNKYGEAYRLWKMQNEKEELLVENLNLWRRLEDAHRDYAGRLRVQQIDCKHQAKLISELQCKIERLKEQISKVERNSKRYFPSY